MSTQQALPPAAPTSPQGRPPKMPRRRLITYLILAGLVLAAGAAYGVNYYQHSMTHEGTDDAFVDGHIYRVSSRAPGRVVKVHVTDNQDVKAGDVLVEIDPRDFEVRVTQARKAVGSAESQRQAAEQNVAIVRGASAASIREAQAGVDQAAAGLAMAKAQVEVARGQLARAEAHIPVAQAQHEQAKATAAAAEAEAKRTEDDLKRYAELFEANRISKQQFDAAATAARAAAEQFKAVQSAVAAALAGIAESEAARKAAADSVKLAEEQVPQTAGKIAEYQARLANANLAPERVAAAEAQLATAASELARLGAVLQQAELELSYTKVLAPADGFVTKKSVEVGQMFQAGQAMFAIVSPDVWVTANFKETQLDRLRPKQDVEIRVDAYPGVVFKGHVDSVQAGTGSAFSLLPPENATGNFVKVVQRVPVKIVLDSPPDAEHRLAPGMSVEPEVHVP